MVAWIFGTNIGPIDWQKNNNKREAELLISLFKRPRLSAHVMEELPMHIWHCNYAVRNRISSSYYHFQANKITRPVLKVGDKSY